MVERKGRMEILLLPFDNTTIVGNGVFLALFLFSKDLYVLLFQTFFFFLLFSKDFKMFKRR